MSDYRKIVSYVDQLHKDLNSLVVVIEKLMLDRGFIALPTMRGRASYGLTSAVNQPNGWRLTNLFRFYIPDHVEKFDKTLFFFINLESETEFEFPPVACGHLVHPLLTEGQVWDAAVDTSAIASLVRKIPAWQNFSIDRGWAVAGPAPRKPATGIRVYLLNPFDLQNQASVLENIVIPLTEESALDEALTIPRHTLPGLQ